jgi:hypothetical protein
MLSVCLSPNVITLSSIHFITIEEHITLNVCLYFIVAYVFGINIKFIILFVFVLVFIFIYVFVFVFVSVFVSVFVFIFIFVFVSVLSINI